MKIEANKCLIGHKPITKPYLYVIHKQDMCDSLQCRKLDQPLTFKYFIYIRWKVIKRNDL